MVKIYSRLLSPTAINTYLYCPRKYYLRYIKRLKSKPSIYLTRGSIVHKAIEKFHQKSGPDLKQTSLYNLASRLLNLFQAAWNKAKLEIEALKLGDEKIAGFCRESRLMMINFSQWLFNKGLPSPSNTEVKLISRNLGLMGVIDAVYDSQPGAILVDYKTSMKPVITEDMKRQAGLYSLLYQDRYAKIPHQFWIHFLVSDQGPQPIPINEKLIKDCLHTLHMIREKVKSSLESDYPCTCGGYCKRDFINT